MIIIPARLQSTRLPRKILAPIGGIPMIIHTANVAKEVDRVVIAVDEKEVQEICKSYGFEAILTKKTHDSGTDRIAECANILGLKGEEMIINLQADEPFIQKEIIDSLKNLMQEKIDEKGHLPFMGSCVKRISQKDAQDPNIVKVVLNHRNEALYFSRSIIPYDRDNVSFHQNLYFGHLGIYAFSARSLQEFCMLPSSTLEKIEKLEQLRALENGKTIVMANVKSESFGIDTPEDWQKAQEYFKEKK
ncbi:MAG: 3-deoxy-manno-octulosonate cytidylyltransferase [Helicobacter sp.]|nr:3-deoxy-manno-octulosonate cytidylyltransferase [Helicobacter sp.]